MKKFIFNLFCVAIPSALLMCLMLELVFRFVIPAASVPDLYFDDAEKMIHYDPDHNTTGIFTMGKLAQEKSKWTINNYGWNSPYNYQEKTTKKRIAIIGDSYVEAMTINNTDAYPFRLNALLKDSTEVYSFGMSGAPLSHYLHISRYVVKKFDPDVLIFNIVHNDFDESLREYAIKKYYMLLDVKSDSSITELEPVADEPSLLEKLIKHSALLRYIWLNLAAKETLQKFFAAGKDDSLHDTAKVERDRTRIELATNYLCGKLREENPGKRIILVMDGPRSDIYKGSLDNCSDCFLNQITKKYAALHQMEFVDLSEMFNTIYQANKKLFNSHPDYHWDNYGHELVTDTLYKYLKLNSNPL